MAYGLKWTIPFVNDNDEGRTIKIYADGFSGTSVVVIGADSPITTQETTDDDMLCPIRTQSGYIRMIDNGNLSGLKPTSNTQHKVVLEDEDGDTLWIGYMKSAEYSSTWETTPNEVQLPIISRVEALAGIEMDDSLEFGMITFGELIAEAANAIGDVDGVYLPAELCKDGGTDYWKPMKITLSRANFFKSNDGVNYTDPDYKKYECDSYKEMLEKICKVFGWCLHERGKKWVFSSATTNKYFMLTVAQLAAMATTTTLSCTVEEEDDVEFSTLIPAGVDHKRDVLQGYRTFEVEAKVNNEDDFLPQVNAEDFWRFAVNDSYEANTENILVSKTMKRHGWIGGPKNDLCTFKSYQEVDLSQGLFNEVDWSIYYTWGVAMDYRVSAAFGKIDFYEAADETSGEKKRYSYEEGIIVRTTTVSQSVIIRSLPIASIRGRRISNVYGGALYWNPGIIYDHKGGSEIGAIEKIAISVRIGNKWWNGGGWNTSKTSVWVNVDDSGNNVIDGKTLSMPYNDAKGYIMPISGIMSGEIELTIYAITATRSLNIMLTDAGLKYAKAETEDEKDDNNSNHYYAANDTAFSNRKKVTLEMATDNDNSPGFGILFLDGSKVGEDTFDGGRLESILLGKLKSIFGRNIEKLSLHVEANDSIQPMARIAKDGNQYQVLSESRDWMTDESTLIIEKLPSNQ